MNNKSLENFAAIAKVFCMFLFLFMMISSPGVIITAEGATSEQSCTDSDGGLNYELAGVVKGIGPNGWNYIKSDTCETGDYEGYLKEFFCNGTIAWPKRYQCPNSCNDGACLPDPGICTDIDEDTFAVEGGTCGPADCDDTNADINPGAAEGCSNGIDDNCDGLVDTEDPGCLFCTDIDGDGYAINGGGCGQIDCNDTDPTVNPGAEEICGNGRDDDCDGLTDDEDPFCNASKNNVVIIGWDGTQWDHLMQCFNKELPECAGGLPNLEALSGGKIYTNVTTSGDSATKPGWAQLLSGYNAEVLNIFSNGEYSPIPEGYSLFEKVEQQFNGDGIVTMFISGKGVHTGGACIGEETTRNGLPVIEDKGQPWCITKNHLNYYENDLRQTSIVGNRALELLEAHQAERILALFLFRTPDVYGHLVGEDSIDYSEQLINNDYWLGMIVAKLHELNIYDNSVIFVVSDHGFDEGSNRHGNAPYAFLASNDPLIMRNGDRRDLTPTILESFGISVEENEIIPALDGYSLYSLPPLSCVPEGAAYIDDENAPSCCADLELISLDQSVGLECLAATGGTNNKSGYCTDCGNGLCELNENPCNCAADCP
jgi:hypothetical protein